MFLFFPWRDGFTSVWNDLTEKQMAEHSKYNFAHVLNGVVFYKVPFAQKAVLHSLYRLAKTIFKKIKLSVYFIALEYSGQPIPPYYVFLGLFQ